MNSFFLMVVSLKKDGTLSVKKFKTIADACKFLCDRGLKRFAVFDRAGLLVSLVPGNYAAIERQLDHLYENRPI